MYAAQSILAAAKQRSKFTCCKLMCRMQAPTKHNGSMRHTLVGGESSWLRHRRNALARWFPTCLSGYAPPTCCGSSFPPSRSQRCWGGAQVVTCTSCKVLPTMRHGCPCQGLASSCTECNTFSPRRHLATDHALLEITPAAASGHAQPKLDTTIPEVSQGRGPIAPARNTAWFERPDGRSGLPSENGPTSRT